MNRGHFIIILFFLILLAIGFGIYGIIKSPLQKAQEKEELAPSTCNATPDEGFPDTGQTNCYNNEGEQINCAKTRQDAEYNSANSRACGPAFLDNGDGTITDKCTGLMWLKCTEGLSGENCEIAAEASCGDCGVDEAPVYNWSDAISRCKNFNFANHNDWRLPNIKELLSIVNYQNKIAAIDKNVFPNTLSEYYWSSTTSIDQPETAWVVNFYDGSIFSVGKENSNYYVRCVR